MVFGIRAEGYKKIIFRAHISLYKAFSFPTK